MPDIDSIALITEADKQIANVRTSGKDFSFNELLSMYQEKELIIDPDFQRLFRWSEEKESRLIESLILELPLPPIYVIELDNGKSTKVDTCPYEDEPTAAVWSDRRGRARRDQHHQRAERNRGEGERGQADRAA